MALIDNMKELKKHNSSLTAGVELANLQSFIDDAINFKIVPAIGYNQLSSLVTNKPTLSDSQARAIDLIQKSVTGFAIANYTDNGSVEIRNTGISVVRSEKSAPASDKKLMQLRKSNLQSAYNALELLVNYLEENITLPVFADYATSDNHKENRSLFINTSAEFQKAGVQINNDAQLYQNLRVYQGNAEETYIIPLIGETTANAIYAEILSNTLTVPNKALLKKIHKALVSFTMSEAIPYKAVTIDSTGVFQLSETVGGISGNVENRSTATDRQLSPIMNAFKIRGEQELETMRKFLVDNATDYGYTDDYGILNDGSAPNIYTF